MRALKSSWLVAVLPAGFALIYSIYRFTNIGYWDGAAGNLVATILGIVSGVPIALWMERQRENRTKAENRRELDDHLSHTLGRIQIVLNQIESDFHGSYYLFSPPTTIFDVFALEFVVPRMYTVDIGYVRCRVIESLRYNMAVWNRIADMMSAHYTTPGVNAPKDKLYGILVERAERCRDELRKAFGDADKTFKSNTG